MSSETNHMITGFGPDYKNPRGIPKAIFIDNIEEFLKEKNIAYDVLLKQLVESLNKYHVMDDQLTQNRRRMKAKVPEIKNTLDAVKFLKEKQEDEFDSNYQICDHVFASAKIKKTGRVSLWLGANTMVEYSYDEAIALLENNFKIASKNLENLNDDIAFLKDQITTSEVNQARVHNFGVRLRTEQKNKK